ncbi:Possible anti-sigma factor [Alloactinosynnema sp. L-07]|uniref:hypothetical protein n=1 Tax=Alloactinosynnema sp. L-07 TaxID=1653480 RepID=UPI00065F0403|nr:hypothetical protein [Alloactinosynnema sp. L-07]CRK55567.1 Possible anti-sigma factor [Alloactinosynnema sp. L-07]
MAGAMKDECFAFRPVLAERLLLGTPLPAAVSRHLDQCQDCSREASELGDVVRSLRRTDPRVEAVAREWPSRELDDRIRDVVQAAARPRRRRRFAVAVAAAAIVAATAVVAPLVAGPEQPPATAATLVRQGPMISHPWGTEVPVSLSGLQPGQIYRLMTVNSAGARAPGGSVRAATGEPVSTRMVTGMRRDAITALIVEDEEGATVIHVPVAPPPTT